MHPLENKQTHRENVCSITTATKSSNRKVILVTHILGNVNSWSVLRPLLYSPVATARGIVDYLPYVPPRGVFLSNLASIYPNICSPTVARKCGLFTLWQPERQNNWLTEGTGFMWSIGQYASDLEVRSTCELEIKVWPSIVGKYRDNSKHCPFFILSRSFCKTLNNYLMPQTMCKHQYRHRE